MKLRELGSLILLGLVLFSGGVFTGLAWEKRSPPDIVEKNDYTTVYTTQDVKVQTAAVSVADQSQTMISLINDKTNLKWTIHDARYKTNYSYEHFTKTNAVKTNKVVRSNSERRK